MSFYKPGDIIYSGKPFAQVVYHEDKELYCDNCFQKSFGLVSKVKACAKCRYVYYCGKECQKTAWSRHKLECSLLCNIPEDRRDFVRLVGQVILLVTGKDWKSISEPVGNKEKNFYDLVSNTEYTKNDPKLCLHGLEVLRLVKCYLGKANVYTDDEVLEIIGKVKHNRFGVGSGSALYLGGSLFDHACIPNANRDFKGVTMNVRAITELCQDEIEKVTISYAELLYADDFSETKESFYVGCKCDDCSLPYGESKLTKILDKTRAWSVIECTEDALKIFNTLEKFNRPCSPANIQAAAALLKKQRGVLGDTNLLRMKLLIKKATHEENILRKIQDLKRAAECVENVFGENSFQLLSLYSPLILLPHEQASMYAEKDRKLRALLAFNGRIF